MGIMHGLPYDVLPYDILAGLRVYRGQNIQLLSLLPSLHLHILELLPVLHPDRILYLHQFRLLDLLQPILPIMMSPCRQGILAPRMGILLMLKGVHG